LPPRLLPRPLGGARRSAATPSRAGCARRRRLRDLGHRRTHALDSRRARSTHAAPLPGIITQRGLRRGWWHSGRRRHRQTRVACVRRGGRTRTATAQRHSFGKRRPERGATRPSMKREKAEKAEKAAGNRQQATGRQQAAGGKRQEGGRRRVRVGGETGARSAWALLCVCTCSPTAVRKGRWSACHV